MVAEVFAVSYYGIAALAVLWNYSKLPAIDWGYITAGAMMLLAAAALPVFNFALGAFVDAGAVFTPLAALVNLVGAALVVVGAAKNAIEHMKK